MSATNLAAASGTFTIGNDLPIHRLGYGAMRLVGEGVWGAPKNPANSLAVLRRVVELGINFIDTSDAYGPHINEEQIAEALHPYKQGLVIATKGGLVRTGPAKWSPVGRADYLRQCVELSLRRLKVDTIDLYQLHRIDPATPAEESLGELKKLQQEGKIRHIGLSEVKPAEIEHARTIVDVVTVQNRYNITDREHEDTLAYCTQHGIGFIPWFPVANGKLAEPGGVLAGYAARHHATIPQLSLAWLLHHSPVILPIPGTSSIAHLEENTAAASLKLTDAEWAEIEAAAKA